MWQGGACRAMKGSAPWQPCFASPPPPLRCAHPAHPCLPACLPALPHCPACAAGHTFPREAYDILVYINRAYLSTLMALLYPLQSGRLALRWVVGWVVVARGASAGLNSPLPAAGRPYRPLCPSRPPSYFAPPPPPLAWPAGQCTRWAPSSRRPQTCWQAACARRQTAWTRGPTMRQPWVSWGAAGLLLDGCLVARVPLSSAADGPAASE